MLRNCPVKFKTEIFLNVAAACPENLVEKDKILFDHKDQVKKKFNLKKKSHHVGYIQVSYPKTG